MVRIFTLLVFLSLINISGSFAQKLYANNWYISYKGMVSFSTEVPIVKTHPELNSAEGVASISDPHTGQLLFYTNSKVIINRLHDTMPNGGIDLISCGGDFPYNTSSSQAALLVPDPGNPSKRFYCFIADCIESDTNQGLNYNIINMDLDSGRGDVESGNKNIHLMANVTEKMAATQHANGKDYWIITQNTLGKYYSFLLTENGIVDSVFSLGKHKLGDWWGGAIKLSPDGNWVTSAFTADGLIELFKFDNQTGELEYFCSLTDLTSPYSGSFSPNSTFFYCGNYSNDKILGWNISSSDTSLTQFSVKQIGTGGSTLQIGPDLKIYGNNGSNYLSVIKNPDNIDSCDFTTNGILIWQGLSGIGLPNFVDSWFLSDSLLTKNKITGNSISFKSYYSNNKIIGYNSSEFSGQFKVIDLTGRMVFSGIINQDNFTIDISFLKTGIYLVQFSNKVNNSLHHLKFLKS